MKKRVILAMVLSCAISTLAWAEPPIAPIPAVGESGLLLFGGVLAIAGALLLVRRRR